MSTRDELDPEFVKSVIAHMNEDHADACLCMVKAFSDETSADSARLDKLDRNSLHFTVQNKRSQGSDCPPARVNVRIDFSRPLRDERQIRGALVGMTGQARKILAAESRQKPNS